MTDRARARRDRSLVHAVAIGIAAACSCLALAACADDKREPRKPLPSVRVEITTPTDGITVRGANVDVRGAVSPARADVRVLGLPARVSDGRFTVVVPLEPGANIVDIAATARDRAPSLTALRVTREVRVTVPDLGGRQVAELEALLTPLGLRLDSESRGGLLDPLIPREPRVCEQQPAPGTKVRRGTTVRVTVGRLC